MKPACIPGKERDQSILSYRCKTKKTNLASVFLEVSTGFFFSINVMDGALHSCKKGFSICQHVLEANRENLLELRPVKYAFRVKPVHPVLYSDECNRVDCKGI